MGPAFTFTPDDNGVYEVTLTVTNGFGGSGTASETIRINNRAPHNVEAGPDYTVTQGSAVTASGSFADYGAADTHTFQWRVVDSNGQELAQGTSQTFSFTANAVGTCTVFFTVTDDDGDAASDSLTVTVQPAQQTDDLKLLSITTPYGDDRVVIRYWVSAGLSLNRPVQIGLYQSADHQIGLGDRRLGTWTLKPASFDTAGAHVLAPGYHEIVVPANRFGFVHDGFGNLLACKDYYLIARLDAGNVVPESNDTDQAGNNNEVVYSGVYRLPGNRDIFIHGTESADRVSVAQVGQSVTLNFNGQTFQYAAGRIGRFRARLHGGDDQLLFAAAHDRVFAWGGAGADYLEGGTRRDVLYGGAGDDSLLGNERSDILFGQGGDDFLRGGPGRDVLLGGAGTDDLDGGPGIDLLFADAEFLAGGYECLFLGRTSGGLPWPW
jgi:Ca2+-binding RTX toxin-like protein